MLSITRKGALLLDRVMEALASDIRREVVHELGRGPASIAQLAESQHLSLPAIHRHIKLLEEAKLVQRKKSGRVNFLAIDRTGLLLAQKWLAQYHAYWGSNEETLDNYVARIELKQAKEGKR